MRILFENYLTRGFWGDEAWTALISSFPLTEIIRVTAEDFHPPFYYFLVHGFIQIFGSSEMIRLISLAFFLITPIPVYLLAKKLTTKKIAWPAAIIVLSSPILFTYGFEARSYALVAFISAFSTLAFWQGLASKKKKWFWIYGILGAVGVYTHYYLWFIFASHGVYWLVIERKQIKRVLMAYMGILVAQLPWVPSLFSQVSSVADNYWIGPIGNRTHWEFFIRVTGGDHGTPQQMFTVFTFILLLIISLVAIKWRRKSIPKQYLFLWFWLLIPVIIPSLISLYRPVFFYRYLIFSSIPIVLISLWGVFNLKNWLGWGVTGFILALYLSIDLLSFSRFPYTMREEVNSVFEQIGDDQTEIYTVLPSFAETMYYAGNRAKVSVLPLGLVQFSGKSLLDSYERQGIVEVKEAPIGKNYWLFEPGPKSELIPAKSSKSN